MSEKDMAPESGEHTVPTEHVVPTEHDDYTVPLVHTHVSRQIVNVGFWGGLGVAAVVGVLEAPVALAIGAAVVVARHVGGNHDEPAGAD